jgi:alkylation response protein AidB-like acyl-CoA dehydrogenase
MTSTTHLKKAAIGGDFLIKDTNPSDTFAPENFTEEQLMIRETMVKFVETEIHPFQDRIENLEEGLIPSIMEKFAELGLFGTHMPEELGGSDMDYVTNTLVGEEVGPSGSFSVSYNAHTGIGMLPIFYYGTDEQKQRYLPELISGALKSSYCLTEPSSGSDALAAKSTAVLNEEGTHYILNGQKMWITNAGFADIFTVFVQVIADDRLGNESGFTAFILEKNMDGFTLGAEEKKLGIKGSSTRMVFMENVAVPVGNLLGEIGKGHLIAFNVLNTGRFKLGASCLGGSKMLEKISIKYAKEREQFDQPIANFGAIQHKLAEQHIRNFMLESAVYRTAKLIGDIESYYKSEGDDAAKAKQKAAETYAIECSIIKIIGSEVLDYVVDENVQIHGGMGYSEEGVAARAYRDARINRIFEGTNEINRMVILSTIFKQALKGQLDLMTPGMAIQNELMNGVSDEKEINGDFAEESRLVHNHKKLLIMLLGTAAQQSMGGSLDLKTEQEILMNLADIIIDIFSIESSLLRVQAVMQKNSENQAYYNAIIKTMCYESNARVAKNAQDAIASFIDPTMQPAFIAGMRKYTKYPLQNIKELRRQIAARILA